MYQRHVFDYGKNLEEIYPKDSLPSWLMNDLDTVVVYNNDNQEQRRSRNENLKKNLRFRDFII